MLISVEFAEIKLSDKVIALIPATGIVSNVSILQGKLKYSF